LTSTPGPAFASLWLPLHKQFIDGIQRHALVS
jgi:hypothetical protein